MERSKTNRAISLSRSLFPKIKKLIPIVITLLAILAIGYVLYDEKEHFQQILHNSIQKEWLVLALVLLFFNVGLEALKWHQMIRGLYPDVSYRIAFQAVLAGSASAFITPQKLGDYVGRVLYLPDENRIPAMVAMFLDRLAQLGATLWFGVWSCYALALPSFYTFALLLVTLCFYGFLWTYFWWTSLIVRYFPALGFLSRATHRIPLRKLILVSFLSLLRFVVFLGQYVSLFKAFGVYEEALWALCCLTFLVKSFVPSWAFSELGIREGVAMAVFSQWSSIPLVVVFQATFLLFVVNTLIPALLGTVLIRNLKI